MCAECGRKTSVTAGTIFDKTRSPLTRWFAVVWAVTNQKNGMSALGLQRALGMDYKTAWIWLHKLRRAMVRPDRDMLSGTVEVDETYVGGEELGVHGRQTERKCIVAIAVEAPKRQLGRVRLAQVPDVRGESLVGFARSVVATGSVIKTDAWGGYGDLGQSGFRHRITNQSASPHPEHVDMPGVHRVASLLKRWLLGTHQGAVSPQHLEYYLDEFTFRFNRRRSKARGMLFYRLLQQAVRTDPVPYLSLVGGRMT
jgi:transposase-like protein